MTELEGILSGLGYTSLKLTRSVVGHFEIDGSINGNEARLLLDTGASNTVVDTTAAESLGLNPTRSSESGGGLGATSVAVSECAVQSMVLGGSEVGLEKLYVMDLSHVNHALSSRGAGPVDGVIGADVLSTFAAVIDYGSMSLFLKLDQ